VDNTVHWLMATLL